MPCFEVSFPFSTVFPDDDPGCSFLHIASQRESSIGELVENEKDADTW